MSDTLSLILGAAESALGVQYKWGGNSLASGVDCSGLVQQAFAAGGYILPRVSADQARAGVAVSMNDLQPGDLIYWDNSTRNQGADHIAIYIGNGMVLEAYKTGEPVRIAPLNNGRRQAPTGVRRIIGSVQQGTPRTVTLGPNQSRTYTSAATGIQATGTMTTAATATATSDALPPNATPDQIEKYIRAHYPDAAGFLDNPEIKKILFDSALAGDDELEIAAKIRKTEYWASHGPSSRAFDLLIAQDGKAAGDLVDNVKGLVGDLMTRQGVTLNDQQLGEVAKNVIRSGWVDLNGNIANEGKLADFVGWTLRLQTGNGAKPLPDGEAKVSADKLGTIAKAYFIPMTDKDLADWALKIMEGTATEDTFTSYIKTLARGRFVNDKSVIAAIDSGISPADYFRPIQNVVAQTLGLNPNDVDLNNSKWMALTGMFDQSSGEHRSMTLNEAAQWARNQPEYAKTPEYRQQDANIAMQLAKEFGAVA